MLHLPAGNGAAARTLHRSKWYGASIFGRKFLEGIVCTNLNGAVMSRRFQHRFETDGVTARREYSHPVPMIEHYFVPDFLPACLWWMDASEDMFLEPYLNISFSRGTREEHGYHAELEPGLLSVSRRVEPAHTGDSEEPDTGGTPVRTVETLWVACAYEVEDVELRETPDRWRPMWYSLDAARRRYLRRRAVYGSPATEHAPLWEMAADWVYAPILMRPGRSAALSFGFGTSRREAALAAREALLRRSALLEEKRAALADLRAYTWFSCGHPPTDRAYGHVVSRLVDCLVVSPKATGPRSSLVPRSATILAGDAYFQEAWRRDENIALGGLIALGQYRTSRSVLSSTWQGQDPETGRLPLRLRTGEQPGYTSSDGTLWALLRLSQYVSASGDTGTLTAKLPQVIHFFRRSLARCRRGLLPSGGISVPSHQWETWMDTEFSARSGYPIEIQLLWLTALERFRDVVIQADRDLGEQMQDAARHLRDSLALFSREDHFVDHLGRNLQSVDLFTPNSYFWTVLDLPFDWEWEDRSLTLGRRELGGVSGIRTLARSQWESVLGPQIAALARAGRPLPSLGKVNYHRGIEWNWLSQLFVAGELRHGRPDMAFDHYLARQIHDAGATAGLGGVSEVFDHRGPAGPDFQTWSMTGLVEALHRFAGIRVDVPNSRISLAPQKPRRWGHIRVRKWYGGRPFDFLYRSSSREVQMDLAFPNGAPKGLTLDFTLRLKRRLPSSVVADYPDSSSAAVQWQAVGQPDGVTFEMPARSRQRITVRL